MKKITASLMLFSFGALLFACGQKITHTSLVNVSLSAISDSAKKENKGVILISNRIGCSVCELFDADLVKNPRYADSLFQHHIIARVDYNAQGREWLSRLLGSTGYPVFLFLDKNMQLKGIQAGYLPPSQMLQMLNKVAANKMPVNRFSMDDNSDFIRTHLPPLQIITAVNNTLNAQLAWEVYLKSKQPADLKGADTLLTASMRIYDAFYNRYLLSRWYYANGDSVNGASHATRALGNKEARTLLLAAPLRVELKTLLNNNYKIDDGAVLIAEVTNKNIGRGKQGKELHSSFEVKNSGKTNLKISKVFVDCQCTSVEYPKEDIKPGEKANIQVTYKTSSVGEFVHVIKVFSNAENGMLQLSINGIIED